MDPEINAGLIFFTAISLFLIGYLADKLLWTFTYS